MLLSALPVFAVTAVLSVGVGTLGIGTATASESVRCPAAMDTNGALDALPDCMRVGRHVRVGQSVSRGTATLGDGVVPARLGEDADFEASQQRRVHAPPGPLGFLPFILFGR